jgi:hypothetical protein
MPHPGFAGDVTRPHDYRTFFANTISLQFTGAEFIVNFGIMKDAANPKRGVEEQCALAMSAVTAKALMLTLKAIIDQTETGGQTIPVAPELTEILKKAVEDMAKRKAST